MSETSINNFESKLPRLILHAGMPAAEAPVAAKKPFNFQIPLPGVVPAAYPGTFNVWQDALFDASKQAWVPQDIPEGGGVASLWPLVVLTKLDTSTDPLGTKSQGDPTHPVIVIQGITLLGGDASGDPTKGDSLYNTATAEAFGSLFDPISGQPVVFPQDHLTVVLRPAAICFNTLFDPTNPDKRGTLVTPHLTAATADIPPVPDAAHRPGVGRQRADDREAREGAPGGVVPAHGALLDQRRLPGRAGLDRSERVRRVLEHRGQRPTTGSSPARSSRGPCSARKAQRAVVEITPAAKGACPHPHAGGLPADALVRTLEPTSPHARAKRESGLEGERVRTLERSERADWNGNESPDARATPSGAMTAARLIFIDDADHGRLARGGAERARRRQLRRRAPRAPGRLRQAVDHARSLGLSANVLTFDPHPAGVVGGGAPQRLTTLERRAELVGELGIDRVYVRRFDTAFAAWQPERFARDLVVGALRAKIVVVGENFRFGAKRAGNLTLLRDLGAQLGFDVLVHAVASDAHGRYSSTRAREAVVAGNLEEVRRVLGRPHSVSGVVAHGDERGRTIGVPTANLADIPELLPPNGVYAVTVDQVDAARGRLRAPRTGRHEHRGATDGRRRRKALRRDVPARLRRRPLRHAAPPALRGAVARGEEVRFARRAEGADRPRHRRRARGARSALT